MPRFVLVAQGCCSIPTPDSWGRDFKTADRKIEKMIPGAGTEASSLGEVDLLASPSRQTKA